MKEIMKEKIENEIIRGEKGEKDNEEDNQSARK